MAVSDFLIGLMFIGLCISYGFFSALGITCVVLLIWYVIDFIIEVREINKIIKEK